MERKNFLRFIWIMEIQSLVKFGLIYFSSVLFDDTVCQQAWVIKNLSGQQWDSLF